MPIYHSNKETSTLLLPRQDNLHGGKKRNRILVLQSHVIVFYLYFTTLLREGSAGKATCTNSAYVSIRQYTSALLVLYNSSEGSAGKTIGTNSKIVFYSTGQLIVFYYNSSEGSAGKTIGTNSKPSTRILWATASSSRGSSIHGASARMHTHIRPTRPCRLSRPKP
jgi:hypothetical protein